MRSKVFLAIVMFLLVLTASLAVPEQINLQGKLTNAAGSPLQGTYNFSFRIYNVSEYVLYNASVEIPLNATHNTTVNQTSINYTNILWEQNTTITTDNRGIYDITLKNINLSFDRQYYLGVTIGSDNESVPRINLSSAPYSFRANVSDDLNPENTYTIKVMNITNKLYIGDSGTDSLKITTQYLNFSEGNLDIAENLTLGKRLVFGLGETIDNIIDGIIRITGTLNVTHGINVTGGVYIGGNVGIGLENPSEKLNVSGNVGVSGNITASYLFGNGSSLTGISEGDGTVATKIVAAQSSAASSTADYICDGIDDEVEINLAINSLSSTGGIVYLLEGTYNINPQNVIPDLGYDGYSAIKISNSSVSLIGSGAGTVLKLKSNWTDGDLSGYEENYMIYLSSDYVVLEDFKIDGNKANQSSEVEYYYGIYARNSSRSKMNRLFIEDINAGAYIDAAGIYFYFNSSGNIISNSYFSGIDTSSAIMSYSSNNIFSNNIIQNGSDYNNGITLYGGDSNIIDSNIITSKGYIGILSRSSNSTITNNIIFHNTISGISLGAEAYNNIISNNHVAFSGHHGISISTNNNIISNNIIEDNDVDNTASYDGLYISSDYNMITGNLFKDNDRYEINIVNSGAVNNYIAGNKFVGSDHEGEINDLGANTEYSQIIGGNNILAKSSGNVGIGTTTPSEKLSVMGNVSLNNSLYVLENGNVGIGTSSPGQKLTVSGNADITGNTVLGSSSSNNLTVNAYISSDLIPSDNARDIGSAANFWKNIYADELIVGNLTSGSTNISGTVASSFIIDSDNPSDDAEDINLIFERGTPVTNAVIKWDSTSKRFDFNQPVYLQNDLVIKGNVSFNNTLYITDEGNVGIGTASPTTKLDVAGTINASAITVSNVNVALHSGISGENITSGIVADARIADTIARDSEVYSLIDNNTIIRVYNETWLTKVLENTTIVRDYDKLGNTTAEIWTVVDNETFARITDLSTLIDNTTIIRSYDKIGNTTLEIRNVVGWNDTGTGVILATTSDNVGIGTATPTAKLDVTGTINATAIKTATLNTTGDVLIEGDLNVTGKTNIRNINISGVSFAEGEINVNNNVNLTSDGNIKLSQNLTAGQNAYFGGNVGINVTVPTSTLHINGTMRFGFGGYIYDNGTALILGHD